jgi:hypothetical protein
VDQPTRTSGGLAGRFPGVAESRIRLPSMKHPRADHAAGLDRVGQPLLLRQQRPERVRERKGSPFLILRCTRTRIETDFTGAEIDVTPFEGQDFGQHARSRQPLDRSGAERRWPCDLSVTSGPQAAFNRFAVSHWCF